MGLAYDLKSVPDEIVYSRARRTGDGSHSIIALKDNQFRLGEIHVEEEQFCEIIPVEEKRSV
jgi:stearoyl-CoA desaturase (delta-9 desaturase)